MFKSLLRLLGFAPQAPACAHTELQTELRIARAVAERLAIERKQLRPELKPPYEFTRIEQLIWTLTAVSDSLEQIIKDRLLASGQIQARAQLYIGLSGRPGLVPGSGRWPQFLLRIERDLAFDHINLTIFDLMSLIEGEVTLATLIASEAAA